LDGEKTPFTFGALLARPQLNLMLLSTVVVGAALALGWRVYSGAAARSRREKDPLEKSLPALWWWLENKFFVDEIYAATVVRLNTAFSLCAAWLDRVIWGGAVSAVSGLTVLLARINRALDEFGINAGFDFGCDGLRDSGGFLSWIQNGRVQRYLRMVGLAVSLALLAFIWGCA
jgi:NADH-quinone oxidoreductase subunit L